MEVDAADLDLDNSSEKLFVFHESVSTLQYIASHKVALQLWHHRLSRAKCGKIPERTYDFLESEKLAELLKTPQRIEEMLKKSLGKIGLETSRWISDFECKIFTGQISRYCPGNLDQSLIVWGQNGNIDGKRSASKMIIYGKLNAEQKFILMCAYGINQELEIFPMNSIPEFFQWLGISDLKIAYWISYHRHNLRDVWLKMPGVIRAEHSLNVTMAMEYGYRRNRGSSILPHVFEHFWNRLSEAEQLAVALRILPGSQSRKIQKIILSTMSPFQQRQLVDQIPLELMAQFCGRCDMPENAFIIWTRIKDRITEQQFVRFLKMIFDRAVYFEKSFVLLTNVWNTASDRLKRHIADSNPDIILSPFMAYYQVPSPSIYRFVMKFLSLMKEHTRKQMIFSINKINIARVQDIDFLNLCLPEEADQWRFKNRIMESVTMTRYCARALYRLEFDDVINTVAFFSRNTHDIGEFFKKLLEADELNALIFILDYENWNKFCNFIDTVFNNYVSIIPELKKQIVSRFSARAVHCYNDEEENFNALVKITEQVFSSEEMKTFKLTMLEHFQKKVSSIVYWFQFEGKCYNALVTWCSDDESRIIDFRDVVPIDAFFDEILRTICSTVDRNPEFEMKTLDRYLRNFCSSDEEIKLLKIRKYYERDGYWIGEVNRTFRREIQLAIFDWFCSSEKELDFSWGW
ncbi:uncharacterized protein LOC135841121 isoform X2 [Planococcus citri]|uniref:uncharacterized protein LOC135841121 isoform X2 n=1 Tax=Planococcus citri TaxID=170843 RepID=UPI0031F992C3